MKPKLTLLTPAVTFLTFLALFSFDRCSDKCLVKNKYYYYTPVYSTAEEIKAAVEMKDAREIHQLGRIYVKDDILFVNEVGQGIHIINNHDPVHPQPIGFLNIPGNFDLAVQGTTLYADSFVDLVALDISDIHHVKEVNRIAGIFKTYSYGFGADASKGIVTRWEPVSNMTIIQSDCDAQVQPWGGIYYGDGIGMLANYSSVASSSSSVPAPKVSPGSTPGVGGSTARFAIVNHFLYSLDGSNLQVVDITKEAEPVAKTPISVAWDVETLFPHNENLFIGARAGMYIFDLSTPELPKLISQYDHIMSCDPVVVEGDYAYVTLYSGGICHVETNQLEVINIKELTAPSLVRVYPMSNPHGVGINNGVLFICDGDDGLKIFDATDPMTISDHKLAHYDSINALDIIPLNNLAMMIGADGIYQYDYSDVKNIKLLSQIPIVKQP